MPYREGQPDLREQEAYEFDSLVKKYLKLEDEGVPQESLELVMAMGKDQAISETDMSQVQRYQTYKAGEGTDNANNLWAVFSPDIRDSANRMLKRLRDLGPGKLPEAQEMLENDYSYRQTPLYYLSEKGHLRQALEKLGPDKAKRFLEVAVEKAEPVDYMAPETIKKMSDPEFQARQAEFNKTCRELYVILHELGVNVARLAE